MLGLDTLAAFLALAFSIVSYIHSSRVKKQQYEDGRKLRQLQERLSEYQLTRFEQLEELQSKSDVDVELVPYRGSTKHLLIRNVGGANALKVEMELILRDGQRSPLVRGDCDVKLPISVLEPGQECPIMVGHSKDAYPPYTVVLTWKDEDGASRRREKTIHG